MDLAVRTGPARTEKLRTKEKSASRESSKTVVRQECQREYMPEKSLLGTCGDQNWDVCGGIMKI